MIAVAGDAVARVGAAIYALSHMGLYGVSAAYHRLAHSPRRRQIMRRLDHSMIFVMIAGTSTPISLVVLEGGSRIVGLAVMWGGALVGVTVKLVRQLDHALGSALYIILGWATLLAVPQLVGTLGASGIGLLVGGGVLYTVGAVILLRRRPDPVPTVFGYHEVWHTLVVGAGVCHYVMILRITQAA